MTLPVKTPVSPADLIKPQNVVIIDSEDDAVTQNGTWTSVPHPNAIELSYIYSNTKGDYLLLTFRGTGLWMRFLADLTAGIANISIDGEEVKTLDMYHASQRMRMTFIASNLSFGVHKLKVEVSGTKNGLSSGYNINVDSFAVELSRGALQILAMIEEAIEVTSITEVLQEKGTYPAGVYTNINADLKAANPLNTQYLKQACIIPPYVTTNSPTGMMVSYEGGYICRALISKAGSGEVALAKNCLDEWVKLQKSDGSWSQQYYPYLEAGVHTQYEDLQVDSGTALLIHAMADYDASQGAASEVYKSYVQLGFNFLRAAQLALYNKVGQALLCNQRKNGVWNYSALAADCGEVLLATMAALDQYGDTLTSEAGYSVKTFGNDLYESIALYLWTGDVTRYYNTAYPATGPVWGLTIKNQISYTQALCAHAIKLWAGKAYNTKSDYSVQAEKALDKSISLCMGKWGGFFYSPYLGATDETRNEYAAYTTHMVMACNAVNSSKYAEQISRMKHFIQLLALTKGEIYDYVRPNGMMDVAINAYYGFLSLNSALGLLAGA